MKERTSKKNRVKKKSEVKPNPLVLFYDIKFYLVYIGHTIVSLRIVTFSAWLSAGWPEWVAVKTAIDPDDLNTHLNKIFGILW